MGFIYIKSTNAEKRAVLEAIINITKYTYTKFMSQAMIAEEAGIKATKVRAVLQDLVNEKKLIQIKTNDSKKVPRYFYSVTTHATEFLRQEPGDDEIETSV